ncbi:MAG: DUF3108 domain-containing protein [Spirochaetota bacterium]|jgi:hypothetical protein|nr:DUF3108 domain-containing protein [Spirochaetota bacterium]
MIFSRREWLLFVLFIAITALFAACGGSDWKDLTKVGNTWEYEGEVSGASITAKVLGNWKVGTQVYAEIAANYAVFSNVSRFCSWDDKKQEFLYVGDSSFFNDGTQQFFIEGRVMGAMKGENTSFTNTDGTVIRYIGEEKIKVPAGDFATYKFTHLNTDKKIDMYIWYASKRGIVRLKAYGDTWQLVKFTEGKSADPKVLGGANAAKTIDLVKIFFAAAQTGDVAALERFFSVEGKQDFAQQSDVLGAYVKRAKGIRTDKATFAFLGDNAAGIRFLQYDESGVRPTVTRSDAVLQLVLENAEMKIQKISIASDNLF